MDDVDDRLGQAVVFLFVPGDRPERFEKALNAGADAIILDLEDGVAADRKEAARAGIASAGAMLPTAPIPVLVRVNAVTSRYHDDDMRLVSELKVVGVVLAKAESADDVRSVSASAGSAKSA